MSPEFLLTSLIVVLAPGTGVIYTLSVAISRGAGASLAAAFGCTLGIIPHICAALFGLAAILHTSALVFQMFKYAGLAYLLYLAWVTLKDTTLLSIEEGEAKRPVEKAQDHMSVISKGCLINVLNPKLSIFFLAFLPQFVSPISLAPTQDMVLLSLIFMLMTLVVFIGYGLGAAYVRRYVIARPSTVKWMRRAFACSFAGLGFRLALSKDI